MPNLVALRAAVFLLSAKNRWGAPMCPPPPPAVRGLKRSEGLLKCSECPFKRAEGSLNRSGGPSKRPGTLSGAQRALSSAQTLFHHTDAQNEICFVGLG